jgi:hypothetical protein
VNAVNLDKLSKQFRRDMAANPKKAALLGLMVVVALYFWGPLAWKFFAAAQSKQRSTADMASLILTDDPAETSQPGKGGRGTSKFRWEKVRQLIRQDARMVSAKFDADWIDPFGKGGIDKREVVVEAPPEDPAIAAAATAASLAIEPKDLGIVLGGVMIGPRSRVATINGESCREGDKISITPKGDPTSSIEFRVHRITRQSVQLEINGRIFTLELTPPKLGSGDQFKTAQTK